MPTLLRSPETLHRIHFQDCDMLGHLNNARYLDYFLNAREDQVAEHYALNMGQLAQEQQAAWVITKHQLSYLKPARQGAVVRIRTQIIHADHANLVVEMQMRTADGLRLLALLWSEMAFVRLPAGTRLDHSDDLLELLEQLDEPSADYQPDGFDDRVKALRQELKKARREP